MPLNLRGEPIDEIGKTTAEVVSSVGCGLVSIVLTAKATEAATVTLYDVATALEVTNNGLTAKKALACGKDSSGIAATEIYCPCKPDAFSNGLVAVVTGDNTKVYITIEP